LNAKTLSYATRIILATATTNKASVKNTEENKMDVCEECQNKYDEDGRLSCGRQCNEWE
jgi:hypothetical protein